MRLMRAVPIQHSAPHSNELSRVRPQVPAACAPDEARIGRSSVPCQSCAVGRQIAIGQKRDQASREQRARTLLQAYAESSMTRAFLRCLPGAPTLCTVLCHRSTDGSHAMTPDNAARSRLSARQETVLWLAIAGILTAAIGFSWNPTPLAQALAAIFIACALVHAAVAYGARRALVLFVACNAIAFAMENLGNRHGLSIRRLSFRSRCGLAACRSHSDHRRTAMVRSGLFFVGGRVGSA